MSFKKYLNETLINELQETMIIADKINAVAESVEDLQKYLNSEEVRTAIGSNNFQNIGSMEANIRIITTQLQTMLNNLGLSTNQQAVN